MPTPALTHLALQVAVPPGARAPEPGKDAVAVLGAGDPRTRVHAVHIDGELDYDAGRDGQRF